MVAEQFGPYRLEALIGSGAMGEVHCARGASALDAPHADGLLHRDVKPSNVLLAGTAGGGDFVYRAGCASSCASMPGSGGPAVLRDKAIAAALIGVVGAVIAAVVGAAAVTWFEPDPPQEPDLPPLTTTTLTAPAPPTITDIPVGDNPTGVAVSPDGRRAYISNAEADTVSVIDTGIG